MMHYPYGATGWGWSIWMMIMTAVFWLAVIGGIALLIVWAVNKSRAPTGGSALDILNKRYAEGQMSREEYEAMKRDILSRAG